QQGPRPVLVGSILLMAAGLVGTGLVTEPWQFYVTFGLMSGAARSALQGVIPGSLIANWFVRRRSAAYGIAAVGPPCSNLLMPLLLTALVATMGWRAGWVGLAGVGLALGLLPALLIVRRRPEDLGLQPDGDPGEPAPPGSAQPGLAPSSSEEWTAREA